MFLILSDEIGSRYWQIIISAALKGFFFFKKGNMQEALADVVKEEGLQRKPRESMLS